MKRGTYVLAGIGLIIVGLLAGIALMLVADVGSTVERSTQVVERVELGNNDRMPIAQANSDSLADAALPAPALQTALLNNRFQEVASRVTPSVVFLQVDMPGQEGGEQMDDLDEQLPDGFFHGPRQSVGSGVIISSQGHIVTNEHVIQDASSINVTLADKRQFEASVVGVDETTDLAVIKIDNASALPVIALGNSSQVEVGEWVIAVGNPFRLTSTVTAGIVGALGRQVNIIRNEFGIEDFIQTDAAISPGNSGGALVNLEGELVGINTAIASRSGSYEGYGFAVPVNLMERVVSDLIEYGTVRRGYLGVSIQEVGDREAQRVGLDQISGVLIDEAQRGGPAHQAGLRDGDVILSVAGEAVNATNELQRVVALRRPGEVLEIEVWRNASRHTFEVELEGRSEDLFSNMDPRIEPESEPELEEEAEATVFDIEGWGFGVRPLEEEDNEAYEGADGVYIVYVEGQSVVHEADVPRDRLLTHVDDYSITSVEELAEYLDSVEDDVVLFRLINKNGVGTYYEVAVPR